MKDHLEFNRVLNQVAQYCGFEKTKTRIQNEKVEFRYLKVKKLLAETSEAIAFLRMGEHLQFSNMSDTTLLYQKLAKSVLLIGSELLQIITNLSTANQVKRKLENTNFNMLKHLSDTLFDSETLIENITSKMNSYGEIEDNASDALFKIRTQKKQLLAQIEARLKKFMNENKEILMDDLIVERNQRSCVLVIVSQKNKKQGMIHGESASGLAVYFEPSSVVNLNNDLQSLLQKEEDEVYRVLLQMNEQLRKYQYPIVQDFETLQILDSIMAKAKYTNAIDGVIATLNLDNRSFYFKNAANPLIDAKKVVRNTYHFKEKYTTMIISGSNTGGKTVTLKTIGLFVLMTMVGIGVSAEEALVPMYDQIFVDIMDEQSIEQSLSTFSSHIKNIIDFTTKATSKSLILLDELGAGSDPKDSQNLALAFLDYFRKQQATVLVTTHFEKIKQYAKSHEDILSASVGFDMEHLQPTYRFIPHVSGSSNAMMIAKKLGVSNEILAIAKQYEEHDENQNLIQKIDNEFLILNEKQKQLALERQLFEEEKIKMKQLLEDEKLAFQTSLKLQQQQFNDKIQQMTAQLETQIDQLKKETSIPKVMHFKKELAQLIPEEVIETIQVGDYVEIVSMKYFGTVEKIQGNKCSVNCNGVVLTTKLTDLKKAKQPKVKVSKTHHVKKQSTSVSEVNVIGMTVEEAWQIIDKMLDNALLAKRYQFTIIHGVGSGKLRQGIHEKLKKLPYVKKFQLTNHFGATEVFFK